MPAVLDDPTAEAMYRVSGPLPFPSPYGPLPTDIGPRQVTLRDRVTIATLIPFSSPHQVPHKLMSYLCELLNREIEKGDTYPMMENMPLSSFGEYWFGNFGAVMIMGDVHTVQEVADMESRGIEWAKECLGSFFVKPNYPGRSSHICNGGFLVTDAARNRGVGRLMGEGYLEWAPKLGYTYSVFNLVYETNVASLRIWDALGFKRIGRIKGAGNLKSHPDVLVDAIMFGRELGGEGDEYVSEERFDKIRFYLKTGTYPSGSDRAEKSRLRSAATHYRLVPGSGENGDDDKLMLKGKEVVSDPHKQYEIARNMHAQGHGGINKTTASIADIYHWVRIKETVSAAIKNCPDCKDTAPKKTASSFAGARRANKDLQNASNRLHSDHSQLQQQHQQDRGMHADDGCGLPQASGLGDLDDAAVSQAMSDTLQASVADMQFHSHHASHYGELPVDPQIMHEIHHHGLEHWDATAAAVAAAAVANGSTDMHLDSDGDGTDAFKLGVGSPGADDVSVRLRETLEAQMAQDGHRTAFGHD